MHFKKNTDKDNKCKLNGLKSNNLNSSEILCKNKAKKYHFSTIDRKELFFNKPTNIHLNDENEANLSLVNKVVDKSIEVEKNTSCNLEQDFPSSSTSLSSTPCFSSDFSNLSKHFAILDLPTGHSKIVEITKGLFFREILMQGNEKFSSKIGEDFYSNNINNADGSAENRLNLGNNNNNISSGFSKKENDKITQNTTLIYSFSSFGIKEFNLTGKEVVDTFLQNVLDWYIAVVASMENKIRYMYQPIHINKEHFNNIIGSIDNINSDSDCKNDKYENKCKFIVNQVINQANLQAAVNEIGRLESLIATNDNKNDEKKVFARIKNDEKNENIEDQTVKINNDSTSIVNCDKNCIESSFCENNNYNEDSNVSSSGINSRINVIFKRYKLTSTKTFNSLFFPQKQELLKKLVNFLQKDGIYRIPGVPHTLTILLHGPPGTGKTSLVKAISEYANRHIISIPLGSVQSNQELFDIVFDSNVQYLNNSSPFVPTMDDFGGVGAVTVSNNFNNFNSYGKDADENSSGGLIMGGMGSNSNSKELNLSTEKLDFNKTVFLLEDIDVASIVTTNTDNSNKKTNERSVNASNINNNNINKDFLVQKLSIPQSFSFSSSNLLTLKGLLSVLDSVVDSPGRIVILTTNHPDRLHPLLLSPDIINIQLCLDYIKSKELKEMLLFFYPGSRNDEFDDIIKAYEDFSFEKMKKKAQFTGIFFDNNNIEENNFSEKSFDNEKDYKTDGLVLKHEKNIIDLPNAEIKKIIDKVNDLKNDDEYNDEDSQGEIDDENNVNDKNNCYLYRHCLDLTPAIVEQLCAVSATPVSLKKRLLGRKR